ncbi:MAG TPA: efflux RND transporter permease subunit [Verrucomicrobiae bacterium]|nr:efflux RND transporter permease subunit [Verrucomicrobiae bacterium]
MWLTRFALSRPVITIMVFVALVVFGTISYFELGRSNNPPGTTFPIVEVDASYPGASPQDMEKLVIKPIEDQLDGIDHLDLLSATAQEGTAAVIVQFKLGTDLDLAAVDVQRRVDTARVYMPTDLDPPGVYKNGASEPLLSYEVNSKSLSSTQIADLVNNQIKPLVAAIPNVAAVGVYGTADREFHVFPDPVALAGTGATLEDIFNAVQVNNNNVPGGIMTQPTREATVAIHAYIDRASDLAAIPLSPATVLQYPVKSLKIGDVAQVEDGHVEMRRISHYNGLPRVYIEIDRDINADELTSTAIARDRMKDIEAQFPQLTFHEISAPADYTAKSLAGVGQSLLEGIVLTSIVMLLFLHAWRNSLVVLISIPTSILSTFIVMKALGFHIDTMSMMGLSLIIGILVDDSIVVLENITRHRDLGEDPMSAAINGRTEIGNAAVAITMVDVVVFLPVAFLPGIVGAYLKEFGAVIVIATLFSLFVSFTLTPLLAARWSVKQRSEAAPKWLAVLDRVFVNVGFLVAAIAAFAVGSLLQIILLKVIGVLILAVLILNLFVHRYDALLETYRSKLLPFALEHGMFVLFTCTVLLLNALTLAMGAGMTTVTLHAVILALVVLAHGIGLALRKAGSRPVRYGLFRPVLDYARKVGTSAPLTIATFAMPVLLAGAMVALGPINFDFVPSTQTGHINMTVTYPSGTPIATTDHFVTQLETAILKIDGIKSVDSIVGRKPSGWGTSQGGNYAELNVQMLDNRRGDTNKTTDKIRKLAYLVPGGVMEVAGDTGNGSGAQIFYSLSGPEDEIAGAAEKVASVLRATPGSVNVQTSAENGAPRLNVDVDSGKCSLLGINPSDVATVARIAVDGAVATKVRTPTGLVDVRVQFQRDQRTDVEQLMKVNVRANDGTLVPISSVATFTWTVAPTKIERLNRQRIVNVLGDVLPGYSLGAVTGPLEDKLKQPGFLPQGVTSLAQGDTQFMQETFTNMGIALILSFMLVYMLMVILYGSFLEPLIVMFSVPMAIIGALIFLALMGRLEPEQGQSLNIISMLGIVMLFGLVAKNGILLVDYSNTLCKRGMRVRDAVLQAAATRFRPIIMTTAAMIFGMLPLALGFAEGGEWRQAIGTVIIGGLLSSLILTLFLVPMIYNTWMGWFERRADRKAVAAELQGATATV